ncbi:formylglycine-generating enzyme family protein [Novipirellula artificiosorum]|uniref:Serine/threonine-protein kinase pkn1 n=1 Tax=Novipirellula artificiosorum TaxID=2528016 RepID=A0A5C6E001_9BACT|nr:SUMF1/EgtB/PvdO family nonheme iron enzyme [Novipirellula artificiosorum]TWU42202.1 Serine/threonine-protein kinase pkn1 [Novipirellula artificiosorum]
MMYLHNRPAVSFSLGFALCVSWTASTVWADAPDAASIGIAKEKPAEGAAVEVEGGFMVPYSLVIPGTDVTIDMVPVPAGTFKLGSPEDEADRNDDEGPQIEVNVDPMWVAKTETTWGQYREYMKLYSIFKEFEASGVRPVDDSNKVDAITAPTELYDPSFTYEYGEDDDQPAVTITQYSAQQFSKWLSRVSGQQLRLPTEAEWEYAARGGTTTAYSWGDSVDEIDDYAWFFDNADDGLGAVASKEPNPFGLYDMHGNAAEWTINQHTPDGYQAFADKAPLRAIDVVNWPSTSSECVVRGGSFLMDAEQLRSAARMASDDAPWKEDDPNFPRSPWWFTSEDGRGVGFRIVRSYQPLDTELIKKFWEPNAEEVVDDVESRIMGGRGGWGLVDPELPAAIKELKK